MKTSGGGEAEAHAAGKQGGGAEKRGGKELQRGQRQKSGGADNRSAECGKGREGNVPSGLRQQISRERNGPTSRLALALGPGDIWL